MKRSIQESLVGVPDTSVYHRKVIYVGIAEPRALPRRTLVGMPTPAPNRSGWVAPRGPLPHQQAPPRPDGLAAVYRRRDPTATHLCRLVQHHLETFLADAAAADPDGDGIPAHGFARIRICDTLVKHWSQQ